MSILISSLGHYETTRWAKVVQLLKDQHNYSVIHLGHGVAADIDFEMLFYNERDGLNFDYQFKGHLTDYVHTLDNELHCFVDMFSRSGYPGKPANRYSSLPVHEYANYFYILLDYFAEMLLTKKVCLVTFDTPPSHGVDYALYVTANCLKVKTIFLGRSLFGDRSFVASQLSQYGQHSGAQRTTSVHFELIKDFKFDWAYMKNIKKRRVTIKPWLRSIKHFFRDGIKAFSKKQLRRQILLWLHDWSMSIRNQLYRQQERQYFTALNQQDFQAKYIYFPLHLQPEMTTSALGGQYNDQILAVEKLAKKLPADWKIYVKENPKQSGFMRGNLFFERLAAIPSVVLVSRDIPTSALMTYANVVSTITGSAGYEAACGGKPVIIFGAAWYRELEGVFEYHDELNIKQIADTYQYDEAKVRQSLDRIICYGYPAVSSYYTESDGSLSETANNQSLVDLVMSQLPHQRRASSDQ